MTRASDFVGSNRGATSLLLGVALTWVCLSVGKRKGFGSGLQTWLVTCGTPFT